MIPKSTDVLKMGRSGESDASHGGDLNDRSIGGRRFGLRRPVGGREHLVFFLEALAQCQKDLSLRVHPAVHALLDAVNRAKRDLGLSGQLRLGHQPVLT